MYNRDKIINVMKEIYEESKQISPYVVIAQPRRDKNETPAQNLDGHLGLHIDVNGYSHGFCDISGEKVDVARNYLMEQALDSGAKYLLFVGEDTVLPYDGFVELHKTAEANPNAIVTGVYYIKLSNAMIMVKDGNHINIPNVDPGQLIEAWQTGMDCMLIPIDILRRLKEQDPELPFCCIGNNINDDIPFIGEDNFFVHRIHKMGVKLLVNTNVQCLHIDLASGKYTAHPSVDLRNYFTNIKINGPLTMEDKKYIDERWISRLPKGSGTQTDPAAIAANTAGPVKYNMGCGRDRIEGYIGVDKYGEGADIKEDLLTLNLPDNHADEILASHVIEHIPQHRAIELLTKWYNVLKPGSKLIMEMPNLEELCKDFANASDQQRYIITLCIYGAFLGEDTPRESDIKNGVATPHLWGYYPKIMTEILQNIGFKEIKILPVQGLHPGKNFRVEAIK